MRYLVGLLCVCALGVVPLVGCSETAGDGGSGGSAGTGGSAGAACLDAPCPEESYCRGECQARAADPFAEGRRPTCWPSPDSCAAPTDASRPVCGCDGNVYPEECDARMAGTDRGHDCSDPSLWPEGYFLCWSEFCKLDSEYCERPLGDGNDANIYESCIELPEPCLGLADPNALCACVIDESYEGSDYYDCVPTERNGAVGASIFFYLI